MTTQDPWYRDEKFMKLLNQLREAENDLAMFLNAGPSTFDTKEDFDATIEKAQSMVYAAEQNLNGYIDQNSMEEWREYLG